MGTAGYGLLWGLCGALRGPSGGAALPVAVVVEAVVAAQRRQRSQPNGVREEDLSAGIDPDLGHGDGAGILGAPRVPPRGLTATPALTCASASLDQSGFR